MNCPKCNSQNIALICYGLPLDQDKMKQEELSGKAIWRGCLVSRGYPIHCCNNCEYEWGEVDEHYFLNESQNDADSFLEIFKDHLK